MNEHEQLAGLLDGVNKGYVGSPLMPLALASVAATGARGFGALQTLINMTPDTDLHAGHSHAKPMKLGRVPRMITATIFGVTGNSTGGPLVGVAAWGSGNGAQQSIEFDIPLVGVGSGGAILAVPCTSLTIQARNDGNFIPNNGGSPVGNVFGPVASPTSPAATCSIALGPKQGNATLTRTIWVINGGAGLAAAGTVAVSIPAWAQRFRVLRFDATQPIQVSIDTLGTQLIMGPISEAANAPPTVYAVPSQANSVLVKNTGAAAILNLAIVFELGL